MKKKLYIFIVIILSFLIFATYKIFVENKTISGKRYYFSNGYANFMGNI